MRKIIIPFLFLLMITPSSLARAQGPDEREVVATGIGLNEDDAKKQAYRAAIQSVVGSLVVAETLVENDQLVQDKILSHSDGYVTKVKQVGQSKVLTNGLVSVTMQVTVKSKQLREKLTAEKITITEMDGVSILTRKETERESKKSAAEMVLDALKEMPAGVIKAEASIEKATIKDDGGLSQITLPVDVSVDYDAYVKFYRGFISTLEQMGYKRKPGNFKFAKDSSGFYINNRDAIENLYGRRILDDQSKDRDAQHDSFLMIAEVLNFASGSGRASLFLIPPELMAAIVGKNSSVVVNVDILDAEGLSIAKHELTLDSDNYVGNIIRSDKLSNRQRATCALFFPLIQANHRYSGLSRLEEKREPYKVTFNMTDAELKQAKSVKCTVTNVE